MSSQAFLKAVLGQAGADALAPLSKALSGLAAFLPARAALSWVNATPNHVGTIPGTDIPFILQKTEAGWSGAVGSELHYAFSAAPAAHVAAAMTVFLDATPGRPELKDIDLALLGKTIDALVKSQKPKHGTAQTGTHAKPIGPEAPIPPTVLAPPTRAVKPTVKKPKLPKLGKPAKPTDTSAVKPAGTPAVKPAGTPTLKLTLSEARHTCPVCLGRQFQDQTFKGCYCFKSLSKSVVSTAIPGGYELSFGDDWDEDAVLTLAESLGK